MTMLLYTVLGIAVIVFAFMKNALLGAAVLIALSAFVLYIALPNIYAAMGNAAYTKGNMEETVKWYKKAVDTKRSKIQTSGVYATVLLKSGRPEEALEHINHLLALKLTRDTRRHLTQTRCLINYKLGRIDEALAEAEELFDEGYITSNSYGLVGLLRLEKNSMPIDELTQFCEKAYDYDDENRDIIDNLTLCYYRGGQYEKAAELAEQLIDDHPEFVEGRYHGAQVMLKLGKTDKAKEYMSGIDFCRRTYMTTVSEEEVDTLKKELGIQ